MTDTTALPSPGEFASDDVDLTLLDWRTDDDPFDVADELAGQWPEHPEANQAVHAASIALGRAAADLIDAFRAHPELDYLKGIEFLQAVPDDLPDPATPIVPPNGFMLTLAELKALEEGNGDRPVRAA